MPSASRTLRVAAVQCRSDNGEMRANLERAAPLLAEAAAQGARLVLCPEFLAPGYVYDESIWRSGEPEGGLTETWLRELAARHAIWVGASYLEASGDDFYNTFALAAPGGSIAGRVRKESLPGFEGWYFKSSSEPTVIETELGRLGVGICQDNHTARFMRGVARADVDLVLMPHSAPCTPLTRGMLGDALRGIAPFYARELGVPVVMVNKVWSRSRSPLPIAPWLRVSFEFPGMSTICDAGGHVLGRLDERAGVLVADVEIDPARKRRPDAPSGYWSRPPRSFPRVLGAVYLALERLATRSYGRNPRRAAAARAAGRARA